MELGEKQRVFTTLVAKLILYLNDHGYQVSFGEAWRPAVTAQYYAATGQGIQSSLHCVRLAIDLNLFRNGKYLSDAEYYTFAGEYWEALTTQDYECAWGGRFKDANHFSITHQHIR